MSNEIEIAVYPGCLIALSAAWTGITNILGGVIVLLYLFIAAGYGYFQFFAQE